MAVKSKRGWLLKMKAKFYLPDLFAKLYELFLCRFFMRYEKRSRTRWNASQANNGPIFIVGAPRSGSTFFYELLISRFHTIYISNFTNIFSHSLFLGFKLQKFLFKKEYTPKFSSKFGNTLSSGWMAPNEAARFWYKVLPKSKHAIKFDEVDLESKKYLYEYINGISVKYESPFVFKNLNASVRMDLLLKLLPNSRFIHITRDPFHIVQSIYLARKKNGISQGEWWSIKPENFESLLSLSEEEMIVRQAYDIEESIKSGFRTISSDRFLSISYEDLCQNPDKILTLVGDSFGLDEVVGKVAPQPFTASKKVKVDKQVEVKLRKAIESIYAND